MFYLLVEKDDKVIASREYYSASECTEKMLIAFEYYLERGEEVIIKMFDSRHLLIKQLEKKDEEDFRTQ